MLVVATNSTSDDHATAPWHPEQPVRVRAARDGLLDAGLTELVVDVAPRPATSAELHLVHAPAYLGWLEDQCSGGHALDEDTLVSPGSWETALLAAGAGLQVIEAIDDDLGAAGVVLVRPPGHHASAEQGMGFCLLNNVAVAAAVLAERGERVAIVDWDVHHGNGTQAVFWDDRRVFYASIHQRGLFPFTGRVVEVGGPDATGFTMNVPLPAGTTGDVVGHALHALIGPALVAFEPSWLLISAGFDGHRADPLAEWELTAGDFADLAGGLRAAIPAARPVMFLEGGYDLAALRLSVGASAAALVGERYRPEPASAGGPGLDDVHALGAWRAAQPAGLPAV